MNVAVIIGLRKLSLDGGMCVCIYLYCVQVYVCMCVCVHACMYTHVSVYAVS